VFGGWGRGGISHQAHDGEEVEHGQAFLLEDLGVQLQHPLRLQEAAGTLSR